MGLNILADSIAIIVKASDTLWSIHSKPCSCFRKGLSELRLGCVCLAIKFQEAFGSMQGRV